jgi:hypothetical protein
VAEYTKSRRFSFGWLIGGIALMLVASFLGEFIVLAVTKADATFTQLVIVKLIAFGVTGFVIGWQSEDSTILEAGLAAAGSIAVVCIYKSIPLDALLSGGGVVLLVVPFAAGIVGGFLGEKMQGDVIVTRDD